MPDHEPAADETAALRARISALSAASLRISASLDLEMVLNEVVESARALTGARYGAIATIDEAGAPKDFVTSGFTADEHRDIVEWPDGPRLFEFFRDLPGPLRIPDVPAYVRALGFSPDDRLPSKTFQGTPMRHRGVHVGNFYLVEKAGGEAFTDEDEEILVLFAAQAATAIANARTYRAERRARADLEALIETSPVGVVVFEVPWCTTRDLGQSLPSTPRSEVPHDEFQAHPAEGRPEGLPCPELAGVRDGTPRSRESDRLARTHRWQARQLELAEADAQDARPTTQVLAPRHRDDGYLGLGVWPGVQAD